MVCSALLRPLLIRELRIISVNAVSFDLLQLLYEHAHRFLLYPRLLSNCVTESNSRTQTPLQIRYTYIEAKGNLLDFQDVLHDLCIIFSQNAFIL
jgi:hypothetical protein